MVHYVDVDINNVIHINVDDFKNILDDAKNSMDCGGNFEINYKRDLPDSGEGWEQLKLDI